MATTTITDLPRDVLVSICRTVLAEGASDGKFPVRIHKKLRCVSGEWRDAADIAFIEHQKNYVSLQLRAVRNPATVRARFPSLIHDIRVDCSPAPGAQDCMAPATALALASLFASPDLRRVLKWASFTGMSCVNEAAAAVSAIVACPHVISLVLEWSDQRHGHGVWADVLAPLTALTGLEHLAMQSDSARPPLPDVPSLSGLALRGFDSPFAPAGSAASLGRLRRLSLANWVTMGYHNGWAFNDPFRLRADLDAGAWRPHLLTRLQKLHIWIWYGQIDRLPFGWAPRVYRGATSAAAVWSPLAPTVTELKLCCGDSRFHDDSLETGMYAGLGELTGLQALVVESPEEMRSPVDFGRVHLPHLTSLSVRDYHGPPIDVARFPLLAHVEIKSQEKEPLVLSSVAALGRLASLRASGLHWPPTNALPHFNLAQLFGGGRPLAALTGLSFDRAVLTWDVAPGVPSAAEFAARAGALLPSLRSVEIEVDMDRDRKSRRARYGRPTEDEVIEFVVPALRALGRG